MNNNIDPILYNFYLCLQDTLGAKIVHRRRRKSSTCIEVVFYNDLCKFLHGRLNTLKEAEACGFWVMCRRQTKRSHSTWHNMTVYQLYLTPVHPKKRHEAKRHAEANQVTFEPVMPKTTYDHRHKITLSVKKRNFICMYAKKVVNMQREINVRAFRVR